MGSNPIPSATHPHMAFTSYSILPDDVKLTPFGNEHTVEAAHINYVHVNDPNVPTPTTTTTITTTDGTTTMGILTVGGGVSPLTTTGGTASNIGIYKPIAVDFRDVLIDELNAELFKLREKQKFDEDFEAALERYRVEYIEREYASCYR